MSRNLGEISPIAEQLNVKFCVFVYWCVCYGLCLLFRTIEFEKHNSCLRTLVGAWLAELAHSQVVRARVTLRCL